MKTKQFNPTTDAVKVWLEVGKFNGYRTSNQLKNEAARKHGADPDSITGGVKLLKREDRTALEGVVDRARKEIERLTWPWDKARLCPVENYAELTKNLDAMEREFLDAASALVGRYDELVESAKARLNGLADTHQFPSRQQFAAAFNWQFCQDRVTDSSDFKFRGIDAAGQNRIAADFEKRVGEQLKEAQASMVERLTDIIAHVREQLGGKTKGKKKDRVITKALWKNLEDALDVLPTLNVFGDESVNELIAKARKAIASVPVEELREDKKLRKAVVKEADDILNDLANFGIGE
jgi:hypothetical protein